MFSLISTLSDMAWAMLLYCFRDSFTTRFLNGNPCCTTLMIAWPLGDWKCVFFSTGILWATQGGSNNGSRWAWSSTGTTSAQSEGKIDLRNGLSARCQCMQLRVGSGWRDWASVLLRQVRANCEWLWLTPNWPLEFRLCRLWRWGVQ